jgi:hypothetical protein
MRPTRLQIRASSAMVAVALLALALAAARAQSPRESLVIVGLCVTCVAGKLYRDGLARRRADGSSAKGPKAAILLLRAIAIGTKLIGASLIVFFIVYYTFMEAAGSIFVSSHWSPLIDERYIYAGTCVATPVALWATVRLRQNLCRRKGDLKSPRP